MASRRFFHEIAVYAVAAYIVWVLLGTVAWVSHLGMQLPVLAAVLPARGVPGAGRGTESIGDFLRLNLPLALLFVLPHSFLKAHRLRFVLDFVGCSSHDRLAYNAVSAVTLHTFLATFTPLCTPIVLDLTFCPALHACLSAGCLAFALLCFLGDRQTPVLLGVSRALGSTSQLGDMDAITLMGLSVLRRGGAWAFILFTGLSILPPQMTLGDAVTRVTAAVYLRLRSPSFRRWIRHVEASHQLTWVLRGALLCGSLLHARTFSWELLFDWRLFAAAAAAAALHSCEQEAEEAEEKPVTPSLHLCTWFRNRAFP